MALTPNSPNADNSMQALKQYGSYIVTAILLALAAYFGWTYWQDNHARVDTVAADHYAGPHVHRHQGSRLKATPLPHRQNVSQPPGTHA